MCSSFTVMKRTHALYYAPVRSKTMHSLFCITLKKLPYTTLRYTASRFILPWNFRARLYYVATSQSRVFAKLLVSNKFLKTKSVFFALYMQYIPPFHMCRRTFQCLTALYWFKLQIKRVPNKLIRWVQLLFHFVDLTKTMQLSAFMHSNYMYQGFKAIMHFQTIINNRNYCRAGKTQVWLPGAGKFWCWSSKNRSLVAQGASKISLVVLWVCLKVSA